MRKPVLGWEKCSYQESWFCELPQFLDTPYKRIWIEKTEGGYSSGKDGKPYKTLKAAKLACEDHLLTLLEPLAKTYEKLKENRKK